jgi:hypothetical protein
MRVHPHFPSIKIIFESVGGSASINIICICGVSMINPKAISDSWIDWIYGVSLRLLNYNGTYYTALQANRLEMSKNPSVKITAAEQIGSYHIWNV